MTSNQILNALKSHWHLSSNADLSAKIGVSKQSINGFQNKKTVDIQARIIALLLKELSQTQGSK